MLLANGSMILVDVVNPDFLLMLLENTQLYYMYSMATSVALV